MGYTHNPLWFISVRFSLGLQERGEDNLAENCLGRKHMFLLTFEIHYFPSVNMICE